LARTLAQFLPGPGARRKSCAGAARIAAATDENFHRSGQLTARAMARVLQLRGSMKTIPAIQRYMSTSPHTIGAEQTLQKAHDVMREHSIRHLPVMQGNQLVGIVSDRDVQLILGIKGTDATKVTVEDAMTQDVITVDPDTGLDEVSDLMAERKAGSVVVMQNHHVVGIFTTVDGMRALSELLQTRLKTR
jgi:acetoin utilization protein AcuB